MVFILTLTTLLYFPKLIRNEQHNVRIMIVYIYIEEDIVSLIINYTYFVEHNTCVFYVVRSSSNVS